MEGIEPPLPGPKPGVMPFHYIQSVWVAGFEPAILGFQSQRVDQATPHPDGVTALPRQESNLRTRGSEPR